MEPIDFPQSYFSSNKMIPEVGDVVTTLWGRKFVHNLANTYGIIGTVTLNGDRTETVRVPISSIYNFVPSVDIMYNKNDGNGWCTPLVGAPIYQPVLYAISSEGVVFRHGIIFGGKNIIAGPTTVVYRIHGV